MIYGSFFPLLHSYYSLFWIWWENSEKCLIHQQNFFKNKVFKKSIIMYELVKGQKVEHQMYRQCTLPSIQTELRKNILYFWLNTWTTAYILRYFSFFEILPLLLWIEGRTRKNHVSVKITSAKLYVQSILQSMMPY